MRPTHLALVWLTALCAVSAGARAETAHEKFDRLVDEPGNRDAFLYADGRVAGPQGLEAETQEGFSDGGTSIFLQHAPRGGIAEARGFSLFGNTTSDSQTVSGGASAEFSGAFRDFWTFSGGTGTGTLVVRGFSSGNLGGDQINRSAQEATLTSTGSFGSQDASFALTFTGGDDRIDVDSRCGAGFGSSCEVHASGGLAQAMWSVTLPFEYGGSASFVSRLATSMATDVAGPSIFGLMHADSSITSIELPAGATLRAASNRVVFENGVWVYTDTPVPPPVPEPATWGLMLAGLVGLIGLRRRMLPPAVAPS